MSAVAELDRLTVTYPTEAGAVEAVRGVSLTIDRGEVHALVGESGSGKSTIGLALAGLLGSDLADLTGDARLLSPGFDLAHSPDRDRRVIRGRRVGTVFQDPNDSLNPYHRIGEQVAEAIRAHRDASREEARRDALELLGRVGLPDPEARAREHPHRLSGGMRQRVMTAIAIANSPELVVADEPTASLDAHSRGAILDLLVELCREQGSALFLITHDLGLVAERADAVTVLRNGEIVEQGTAERVFHSPQNEYTRRLLAAVPSLEGRGRTRDVEGAGDLLVASGLTAGFRFRRGLAKHERIAVDRVDLTVRAGEAVGLVGESGCGKSTLCRLITGLIEPRSGSIRYRGDELVGLRGRSARRARSGMQMVFQDPFASLNPRHRVGRIIAEPILLTGSSEGDGLDRRTADLLEAVGLDPAYRGRYPHQLSGGERQRVAIARALGPRPDLIVADEPVSSLDVTVQASILDLFAELQEKLGFALIFVSHDLAVVRRISDRIVVMQSPTAFPGSRSEAR